MIKKAIKKNNALFYFLIVIFFLFLNNFFYNFYYIYKKNLDERLTFSYGYCKNEGYGFISHIFQKYDIKKNILILNDNANFSVNNSIWFKFKLKNKINSNYIILLNNNKSISSVEKDNIQLKFKNEISGNYKIIEKFENCFFLSKI